MDEDVFITDYPTEDCNDEVFNLDCPSIDSTTSNEISRKNLNNGSSLEDTKITKSFVENVHKKTNVVPLIIMAPPEDIDGNPSTPFHFDRQAPARISTSPTLRRLRKHTAGNFMSLQDFFDASKFPTHKEEDCILDSGSRESENHLNASDQLTDPALYTNSTDVDKASDLGYNETPTIEKKEAEVLNQCAKMKEFQQSQRCDRRRSSVVLSIPGLEVFPGDLLVSDGASDYMYHSSWLSTNDAKKPKWPFSKKASFIKGKQKQISDLENCLSTFKIPDFTEYEFYHFKEKTWDEFRNTKVIENKSVLGTPNRKRQESIWELFTSECTYFLEHLLVLKMIFLNALKHLQNNDYLLDVDTVRLFANLEDLNQESLNFATSLYHTIESTELGFTTSYPLSLADLLRKYFKEHVCFTHQIYCINYTSAIIYLESLKQREHFSAYVKWCEQQEQCRRLHLTDLLVAPLHRMTRYPLLLKNIWKRCSDVTEKVLIYSVKENVETSIRDLEGKVKWLDKSQKFRQLQDIIVWPYLWERDKRFFIPEGLKHCFKEPNVENILSSPNRHLLYEGRLALTESTYLLDVYLILFDDFLLITKIKRNKRKSSNLEGSTMYPSLHPELQSVVREGGYCKVVDQPIPLDRLSIKSIDHFHVTVHSMRHAFLIQHENRYQQCIAAFILQASTESAKKMWLSQIETAISCYTEAHETNRTSIIYHQSAEI